MTTNGTLIALKMYDDARQQQLQDENEARLERIARRPKKDQIWISPFWCEDYYGTVRIDLNGIVPRRVRYEVLRLQKAEVMGATPLYNRIVLLMNRRLEEAQALKRFFDGLPICKETNELYELYRNRFNDRFPLQQHQLDRLERAQNRRDHR